MEEILGRQAELAERLRKVTGLQSRGTVERRMWSEMRTFQGRAVVGKEEEALAFADGSVGAAVVWMQSSSAAAVGTNEQTESGEARRSFLAALLTLEGIG